MNASCLQENLHRVLQINNRVTPGRTTMPIVQNTLIRTAGKDLEFVATNLEMTVRIRIPADVEAEGELTAPNKLLSDFVNTLPREEPVYMEKADGSEVLRIKCGYSKANVNGTSATLFPPVPEAEGGSRVIITA